MLKRLLIGALLLLCARTAFARQRYFNYCMKGGEKPVTQGLVATHPFQRTYASCTVHVYESGTLNLATLYSDNLTPLSTPLANPFTSAADGYFEFYAVAGRYDVQITDVPSSTSYTWGDIMLCDPLGPNADTACTPGGVIGAHNLLSATHPDTVAYSPPQQGDMIRANSNRLWERFARGTASQFLSMDATGANFPIWQDFNFYSNSTTAFNAASRMGINLIPGSNVTITPHDDPAHNRAEYTITASLGGTTYKTCAIIVGADNNGVVLTDADLGPQMELCQLPSASTLVEITVTSDGGTPSLIVEKRHCSAFDGSGHCNVFTLSDVLSGALSAAGLSPRCARSVAGATCVDGTTSDGAVTIQNTAFAAGDWIELKSGTAGGVAKRVSVMAHVTVP